MTCKPIHSLCIGLAMPLLAGCIGPGQGVTICSPKGGSFAEALAVREVRRYVYARTGQQLTAAQPDAVPTEGELVVVARKDRPIIKGLMIDAALKAQIESLGPQQFALKTITQGGRPVHLIVGGDDVATLYAAYRFAEHLGVRFYLHGDVIPDQRIALKLPKLDEVRKPLFAMRGIQPFHDFPEGPDWWNLDDYKAIISQLPKLGMNFIGLHTYPENRPAAEPTVWIGLASDTARDGRVAYSYPSIYYNTALEVGWGFQPKKTSDYSFGAAALYDRDAYSSEILENLTPEPVTPEQCNEVFNRAGVFYRRAFEHAHKLGVKTCVGTETTLVIPARVQERLKTLGKDPKSLATVQELYEGMFSRIMKAYPIDYYWFWTPEGWTWEGVKEDQVKATIDDIKAAYAAAKKVGAPFQLGTCGWVLGPPSDRALFDKTLPKDMFTSCISRQVGHAPIEPGFADVSGRDKWAIPWLEDDPAMTSPQLWVGRMRKDAVDSLRYGCNGLLGIHWRTRIIGPNVSALAQAAWEQGDWVSKARTAGPLGGQIASFPGVDFADTTDDALYQAVRFDVDGYRLEVPNGTYTVRLQFCEPAYKESGKRVFGVRLQSQQVIDKLDIFAKVGKNRALECEFKNVEVKDGWVNIDFTREVELPCIAAIAVFGKDFSLKVNCGGAAYKDYVADLPVAPKYPPTDDFYLDWARCEFGASAAQAVARVFAAVDGKLPRPSDWVNGPGGIKPDGRSWGTVSKEYAFVDELAAIRPQVKGAGNLARFDFWLDSFRFMRANARVNCTWARYNTVWERIKTEKDENAKRQIACGEALPIRKELIRDVAEVYRYLLPTVDTPGALGTVTNWEQHITPVLLTKPGEELARLLGEPLPADAQPSKIYEGPARVFLPTIRSSVAAGESLTLKAVAVSRQPVSRVELSWRPMGETSKPGKFTAVPMTHIARGWYAATLPADATRGWMIEYYVRATTRDGQSIRFPATAPDVNQTVVVAP